MFLMVVSLLSSVLAIFCPFYGYSLYRRFETWLSERIQAVKEVAFSPWEQKYAGPVAARTRNLPEPVRRFFERSLRGDDRPFRLWVARQIGELRFGKGSKWMAIDSQTVAAVQEPAFAYTGTMQMGPGALMWVRGHEGYLGGKGQMQWKLWGAVQLAKQEGPQVDQSALVRYLAEAVCFPPALLPSPHLKWLPSPTDPDHCASAVLSSGGASAGASGPVVAATFTFDSLGRVRELRSNDFYRTQPGGRVVRTPWVARASGYMRFGLGSTSGGIEIPTNLEVAFVEPSGEELVYGKFTVASVQAEC